jgi:hypothetical protein
MKDPSNAVTELPAAYARLQKQLGELGWMATGSLVERNKPGQGGPRYQWSRRVRGKTITVALSQEQFEWLKTAIANLRQAWAILAQMEKITLKHMWTNIPGPPRRKSLSKISLGVN